MHASPRRTLAPVLAVAALALTTIGCPDNLAQLCPAGSVQAGVFNTSLAPANAPDPDQCVISRDAIDGGPADASLASGPQTFSSVICTAVDVDGGPIVYLALPTLVRASTLGDGGTFSFSAVSLIGGTSCGCNIYVTETISGQLIPEQADASVALHGDAGLPPLVAFTGSVVDVIDAGDDAGVVCDCNVPCDLQYSLNGSAY